MCWPAFSPVPLLLVVVFEDGSADKPAVGGGAAVPLRPDLPPPPVATLHVFGVNVAMGAAHHTTADGAWDLLSVCDDGIAVDIDVVPGIAKFVGDSEARKVRFADSAVRRLMSCLVVPSL